MIGDVIRISPLSSATTSFFGAASAIEIWRVKDLGLRFVTISNKNY